MTPCEMLRCRQTLEPLARRHDGFFSSGADLLYPVREGLVFMGYDDGRREFMELTMDEEQAGQADSTNVADDLAFLSDSAPLAVDALNVVRRLGLAQPGARTIDVGGGSGWVSWLLAEAGYDPWIVDFEANSLWLGGIYRHERLPDHRRIVAEATALPFADGSFSFAVCKEFAHHVDDKRRLFAEVARVLEPGGVVLLMEPIRSIWRAWQERRRDLDAGHSSHAITFSEGYLLGLRRAGFRTVWRGRYFHGSSARLGLTAKLKERALADLRAGTSRLDPANWLYEHVAGGGGAMIALARKQRAVPAPPRPRIRVIDPSRLTVGERDRQAFQPLADALPNLAVHLQRA